MRRTVAACFATAQAASFFSFKKWKGPIMTRTNYDIGVASQSGHFSDAVEVRGPARWLFTAGTPGLETGGILPPDITGQADLAWRHIVTMLEKAGMTVNDLVKVTQYLVRPADIASYRQVRTRILGAARPASMLMVVAQLPNPEFLLEIEAIAAVG
jgi:2-iminobutanoate/2-iminopropanoate deaminase